MPFPLLQALLLLLLLPLLAVSQNSVSLLVCSLCFRGAIQSSSITYFKNSITWQNTSHANIMTLASLKICPVLSCCLFQFLSYSVFLMFTLDFKFILISPPMVGCTVLSLVNVCLFPQSARSTGLRVIPTAWHFRLWVCLPLLIPHTSSHLTLLSFLCFDGR